MCKQSISSDTFINMLKPSPLPFPACLSEKVLRKVLEMEESAERGRVELSALLTKGSADQLVAFQSGKHTSMVARLRLELAAEEVGEEGTRMTLSRRRLFRIKHICMCHNYVLYML